MANDNTVDISIKATNLSAAAFQQVQGDLKSLDESTKQTHGSTSAFGKLLEELNPKAATVGESFLNMKGTLSELFEKPTAGASQLAGALSEDLVGSLGAVGIAAGIAAGAVGVLGVAAFELSEKAAGIGANFNDMSEKTGIAVPRISQLSYAATVAGTDINTLSNAVFMMQRQMELSPDRFADGLQRIGLSFEEFKRLTPDQQLLEVAEALKRSEDPANRNAAAVELIGRGARESLPALMKLSEAMAMTAGITPWTDEEARQAEAFEMEVAKLKLEFEQIGVTIGREVLPWIKSLLDHFNDVKLSFQVSPFTAPIINGLHDLAEAARYASATLDLLRGKSPDLPTPPGTAPKFATNAPIAAPSVNDAFATDKHATRDLEEEHHRLAEATKKAGEEAKRSAAFWAEYNSVGRNVYDTILQMDGAVVEGIATDLKRGVTVEMTAKAWGVYKEQVTAVRDGIVKLDEQHQKLNDTIEHGTAPSLETLLKLGQHLTNDQMSPWLKSMDDASRTSLMWKNYTDEVSKSHAALGVQLTRTIGLIPDLSVEAHKHFQQMAGDAHTISDGFAAAMDDLPGILARAFEGGGGIEGALKAGLVNLAQHLFGKDGVWTTEVSTQAKVAGEIIQASLAVAAGLADPRSRGGAALSGAAQGAAIGTAIMPGYGTAIGAGVGALVGALGVPEDEKNAREQFDAFKRQLVDLFDATASGQERVIAGTDDWAKMIGAVRQAYFDTGHTNEEVQEVIDRATRHTREDVEKLPDDLREINKVLQEQQRDQQDLQAAIKKYGFSIEELGPKFQQQELTKQALGLENSFRLLVGAGADAHLVIDRMGDDINSFIHTALKTGTEVPAEMRPMLQQMVEMGKLTDENGKVITDLGESGITFSETMTQGFDRVVNSLEKVLRALGWVDDAVTKLPNEKTIKITPEIPGSDFPLPDGTTTSPAGSKTRILPGEQGGGLILHDADGNPIALPDVRKLPVGGGTIPTFLPTDRPYQLEILQKPGASGGATGTAVVELGPASLQTLAVYLREQNQSPNVGVTLQLQTDVPTLGRVLKTEMTYGSSGLREAVSAISRDAVLGPA